MKAAQKLYAGIALILVLVGLLLAFGFITVSSQQNKAAKVNDFLFSIEGVKRLKAENRLSLLHYLLSGDDHVLHALTQNELQIDDLLVTAQQKSFAIEGLGGRVRALLEDMRKHEAAWKRQFALPLIDKRQQVDQSKSTVAELQIAFLQADLTGWDLKESRMSAELTGALSEGQIGPEVFNANGQQLLLTRLVAGFILLVAIAIFITFILAGSLAAPAEPWSMTSQAR